MSGARNKLVATLDHIKSLKIVIGVLAVMVIAQWMRIGHLQDVRRIYVPPNMTKGIVTSFEEVPAPVVYTFGLYIFQQLNRWEKDGEEDYPEKIYQLQAFMTPSCISAFEEDMNVKRKRGELRRRARMLQEISGRGFHRRRVAPTTDESWTIWIDTNLRETIANHEVKNVNLRYTLTIVKFDVDKEVNPWGLALECDAPLQPTLLTEEDLKKTGHVDI